MKSIALIGLLAAANYGFAAENLEMYLRGEAVRRPPLFSPVPAEATGNVGRIEVNLRDGNAAFGGPAGVFSFANERGSFAIHAVTSPSTASNMAGLRWKADFVKLAENVPFKYTVNPAFLYIIPGTADVTKNYLAGFALLVKVNGELQMLTERVIEGHGNPFGPSAFGVTSELGPIERLVWDPGSPDAYYGTRRYVGELDLSGISPGETFTVEYEITTKLIDHGGEGMTEVYVGDPLKYGSGMQMSYGAFGELFFLYQLTLDPQEGALVAVPAESGFYFILCRRIGLDGVETPIDIRLGSQVSGLLRDPNPPQVAGGVFYTVKKILLSEPLDSDGDGIDDVYELEHASILDPLDAIDGSEDPDGDGYSNLAEYTNGTDPLLPDPPPPAPVRFAGLIVPSYSGGEFVDLNNDGVLDLASSSFTEISAALGNASKTFQTRTNSPVPGARAMAAAAFAKLDGDPFTDAVAVDQLANRLFVLHGVGDGRFELITSYPTTNNSQKIAVGDLNGDGINEVATMSPGGRGAELFVGLGDGTFTRLGAVTTNLFGTARTFALADFNGDGRDDVVVTYFDEAVVYLSQTNGSFAPSPPYATGGSPDSLAIGDLNGDGLLDIVVANRSSDDLSVLRGVAGGTFLPQVRYAVGDLPLGLQLADLNGDTFLDVAASRAGMEFQTVFLNNGDGTLGAPSIVPSSASLVDIMDWDGDGHMDIFNGIASGGLVSLGHGDGTFDTRLLIVPTNTPPTDVKVLDVDGDGTLELVGINAQANAIDVWEHAAASGTNRLRARLAVGPHVVGFAHSGSILAVATGTNSFGTQGTNQIVVFTNQVEAGRIGLNIRPHKIVSGDLNGDGNMDLAVTTLSGDLGALIGDGAGGFSLGPMTVVNDIVSFAQAVGTNLVLQGNRTVGGLSVDFIEVYGLEGGAWTNRQTLAYSNSVGTIHIAEMNGDAFPDIVTTELDFFSSDAALVMYPGGASGFGAREVLSAEAPFQFFNDIADLNGDSRMDVIVGDRLLLGRPGSGFYDAQTVWIGPMGVQQVADFNHDGKADLMSGLAILLQK